MLLSVCIPTYNRGEKVLSLLQFLSSEINGSDFYDDIEILVSDNCSTDNTQEVVSEYINGSELFVYNRNEENLGLIGNLHKLVELSKGDYVWFMGDDDKYYDGIIDTILSGLQSTPAYMFLNHRAYEEGRKENPNFSSAIDVTKPSFYKDGREAILDIWNYTETSLMFISSSVFRREILIEAIKSEKKANLSSPLYYSLFVGAKGNVTLIKEIFVDDILGSVSWESSKDIVFLNQVPCIITKLAKLGYGYITMLRLLSSYVWKRKFRYIKHIIKKYRS